MHGERVDGNDVLAVREATGRLLRDAREERRPALLETITYRFRGHSVADAGKVYRTAEEIDSWRKRDPITRFGLLCSERGLLDAGRDRRRSGARSPPRSSPPSTRPLGAAFPDPDTLYEHVYGDPAWREQFSRMRAGAPFGERGEERTWQT